MRRWPRGGTGVGIAFFGLLASACAGGSGGGSWAVARVLPATLTGRGVVYPSSVWCASPGNCIAGGWHGQAGPGGPRNQAFAVSEAGGRWGMPQPIRGLGVPVAESPLAGISCTSAGNCLAAGAGEVAALPVHASPIWQARVAREVNGAWGRARPLPGLAALSHGELSQISTLSCTEAGWCVVVGSFWPATGSA